MINRGSPNVFSKQGVSKQGVSCAVVFLDDEVKTGLLMPYNCTSRHDENHDAIG